MQRLGWMLCVALRVAGAASVPDKVTPEGVRVPWAP